MMRQTILFVFLPFLFTIGCGATIHYTENHPLDKSWEVTIGADLSAAVSEKKLKPFCEQPADSHCWVETKTSQHVSEEQYQSLVHFILSHQLVRIKTNPETLPSSAHFFLQLTTPGKKASSVSLGDEDLDTHPDFRQFQKMLHEMIQS